MSEASSLSVCCLSGGPPGRLAALLQLLRPVADELVVAVDDRVDRALLAPVEALTDVLVSYPYAEPVERPLAWLHSLCSGDWVFRIDDDEVPSEALLAALADRDERLTHAWVPRRWLWDGGWLADDPWTPDWQLRLVRPSAARFPGRMHVPIQADGPHAYLEAPLYHLDLVANDHAARVAKARRYELNRPGLRIAGLPLNSAYYLPELRDELAVASLPHEDAALVERVRSAPAPRRRSVRAPRRATRAEIDAHWADGPLAEGDYRARIELCTPPSPVAGELRAVDIRVTNLGSAVWRGGANGLPEVRLSYRWRSLEHLDEQPRTPLPHDLHPGESTLVPVVFRAPEDPGRYELVVDLVHERHRWFGADACAEVEVRPRRQAVVLVGQPPGEEEFDRRVEDLLGQIDASLEPVLVGPKEDWLRDRFGTEARSEPPSKADRVFVVAAGQRRSQLRLQALARRLERRDRGVVGSLKVVARTTIAIVASGVAGIDRLA